MPEPQIGRLAFREEGEWWKAYYAMPHTMDRAILIGQIGMKFVSNTKQARERKREFMLLMQAVFSDLAEEVLGARPSWPEPPQPAPEHERKI